METIHIIRELLNNKKNIRRNTFADDMTTSETKNNPIIITKNFHLRCYNVEIVFRTICQSREEKLPF